jgi:hypothetical protein
VPFLLLDPGWVKINIRIRDEHPGSFFFEEDPNLGSGIRNLFDPGSGMEKFRSRDKHPRSATLVTR